MRIGTATRKGRPVSAAQGRVEGPSVSVVAVGGDDGLRTRLSRLAGRPALAIDPEIVVGPGISSSLLADVEVAVVALGSQDATGLSVLRWLRRWNPRVRLVVVGRDLALFEDAFDCGADAWVGTDADDDTLRTAIRGRWAGTVTTADHRRRRNP